MKGKKHGKNFYKQQQSNQELLSKEYKGFYIPCATSKEKFAVSEAYNILNQYTEKLYPEIIESLENQNLDQVEKKVKTTDDHLQEELQQIRQKSIKLFYNLDIGIKKGIIFIRINDDYKDKICVYKIVDAILTDIHENSVILGKNCLKIVPIELVIKTGLATFEDEVQKMIENHIPKEDSCTWQFEFKCVFNDKLKNQQLFLDYVLAGMDAKHRVNFKNPDYTILLYIYKNLMMVSFLKNWTRFRKYSLIKQTEKTQNEEQQEKKPDIQVQKNDQEENQQSASNDNDSVQLL